jgi:hypothetical protein
MITTHSTAPLNGEWKYAAMAGRLMFTIEESSVDMNTPTAMIANTVHLYLGAGGAPEPGWEDGARSRWMCDEAMSS